MDDVEVVAVGAESVKQNVVRTNWATNIVYSTNVLHEPSSVEEIQELLKSQLESVTAVGTGHTFNFIADNLHNRLSLRLLPRVLHLDAPARTVTVDAGTKYDELCPFLHRHGFALHNLASLTQLSIAGACSTAVHGSGDQNGSLATAVCALELATANGSLIHLSRHTHGDTFPGAVVGLGALGVITRITLDIQPAFTIRQFVYENLPLSQLTENFDAIMSAGYTVSLFTDWQEKRLYQLWIKIRDDAPNPNFNPDPPSRHPAPEIFFGAKLQSENVHLVRGLPAIECTEQMGVPGPSHERLPHFRPGFMPGVGDELQSEYFLPRRFAVEAILAVEHLRDEIAPVLLESEIRTVAADDLWLSPCYGRDSVVIHFCWRNNWDAVRRLLPTIERALAPWDPRPHWGKLFTMTPHELQAKYAQMPAFRRLAAACDPTGKFRNAFLNTYVAFDQK
ncbi:hypothetical protein M758_12G188600 [Ceratodon purpureus]|nr:hypothetical protein M758_12G188600 [Ceratodon purpureus]